MSLAGRAVPLRIRAARVPAPRISSTDLALARAPGASLAALAPLGVALALVLASAAGAGCVNRAKIEADAMKQAREVTGNVETTQAQKGAITGFFLGVPKPRDPADPAVLAKVEECRAKAREEFRAWKENQDRIQDEAYRKAGLDPATVRKNQPPGIQEPERMLEKTFALSALYRDRGAGLSFEQEEQASLRLFWDGLDLARRTRTIQDERGLVTWAHDFYVSRDRQAGLAPHARALVAMGRHHDHRRLEVQGRMMLADYAAAVGQTEAYAEHARRALEAAAEALDPARANIEHFANMQGRSYAEMRREGEKAGYIGKDPAQDRRTGAQVVAGEMSRLGLTIRQAADAGRADLLRAFAAGVSRHELDGSFGYGMAMALAESGLPEEAERLAQAARAWSLLALADPVYGPVATEVEGALEVEGAKKRAAAGIAPLPETREEAEAIAPLFPERRTVLLGADAREGAFKKAPLADFTHLHLATHGVLPHELPAVAEPALVLAAEEGEDAFLTASEVQSLSLSADVAVLSACNTGSGEILRGEGVQGLGRAFLIAGSETVVVSLWPVASAATRDLMTEFYGALAKGLRAPEAMRHAQLAIADRGAATVAAKRGFLSKLAPAVEGSRPEAAALPAPVDVPASHPFLWAPFVVFGRAR
jgi:hypothetical protein